MKRLLVFILMMSCITGFLTAQAGVLNRDSFEVPIGDPESDVLSIETPFNYTLDTSVVQAIYLSSEINTGGMISAIRYDFTGSGNITSGVRHRVWMAMTTRSSLYPGPPTWIPYSEFELVFDGIIDMNITGSHGFEITLDTPFEYSGTNLAIMTQRHGSGEVAIENRWRVTLITGYRCIAERRNGEDLDPANLPSFPGAFSIAIPNVTLIFSPDDYGNLAGQVTSGTPPVPLEGVTVSIDGTQRSTVTNLDGRYSFSSLPTGNVDITAHKTGYLTETKTGILIENGGTATQDIEMTPISDIVTPPRNVVATPPENNIVSIQWEHDAPSKGFLGYRIFRSSEDAVEDPDMWVPLDMNFPLLTFEDDTWGALEPGDYLYIVQAVYIDDYLSEPAFSNVVIKIPENDSDKPILPLVTALRGNYPNPFNPSTTISFYVGNQNSPHIQGGGKGGDTHIRIDIYNIKGQKIQTVLDGFVEKGEHTVIWNGRDEAGNEVGSGVYFYQMTTGEFQATRSMVLLK